MTDLGKMLIILGLVMAAIGAAIVFLSRLGFGRLPGDIVVRRGGFTFVAPIATSIVLSIILTIILNLLFRRR